MARSDLPTLMGLDHTSTTDRVWQLELRRETRVNQVSALFREVRLPRTVSLSYPNDPFALADEWRAKAAIWVAAHDNQPIGYLCATRPRAGVACITDIVVQSSWRRKGVATTLLQVAHTWCGQANLRAIFLEMQSKNQPAIAMAQKNGYEYCGYNDRYYPNRDVMLVFSRAA